MNHPFSGAGKPLPSADILNSKNPLPFAATFKDLHIGQTALTGKGKAPERGDYSERKADEAAWLSRNDPFSHPFSTPPGSPSLASTSKSSSRQPQASQPFLGETKEQVAERKISECVASASERLDLSDRALEVLPDSIAELRFISRLRRREVRGSLGKGPPQAVARSTNPLSPRRSSPLPSSPGRRLDFDLAGTSETSPTGTAHTKRIWARSKSLPESAFTQSSASSSSLPPVLPASTSSTSTFSPSRDRYGSPTNPFGLGPPPSYKPEHAIGFDAPGSPLPAADEDHFNISNSFSTARRFATAPSKLRVRFGDSAAGPVTKSMNDVADEPRKEKKPLGSRKGMVAAKSMSALTLGRKGDGHESGERSGFGRTPSGRVFFEEKNWLGEGSADVELMLSSNHLTRLPSALFMVTNLTVLSLRGNRLKRLPAGIGQLTRLKELNVSNNLIPYFPPSITDLKDLENLICINNPLIKSDSTLFPSNRRLGPLTPNPDLTQIETPIPSLRSLCLSRLLSTSHPTHIPLLLTHYDLNPESGDGDELHHGHLHVHALQDSQTLQDRSPYLRLEECRRIIAGVRAAFYAAPGRVFGQGVPDVLGAGSPTKKTTRRRRSETQHQPDVDDTSHPAAADSSDTSDIDDAADNPFFSPCSNPSHYTRSASHTHSHAHSLRQNRTSRWIYLHQPAETRIEYVDLPEARGIPILWEGCGVGCLDWLEEGVEEGDEGEEESLEATDVDTEDGEGEGDGFDVDVLGEDGEWT